MTTAAILGGDPLARYGQAAGAWVWDVAAGRLYGDARFAELTGLDPAEAAQGLPTDCFFSGILEADRLRVRIAVAGVLRGVEGFARDFRVRDVGGEVRWVSARGRGERDAADALTRFVGVLTDVTEQKRIEEQLRIAQRAGGVGTFEHTDGFGTVSVSEQFCHLLGLHPADALPVRTINALAHPADPPLIRVAERQDDEPSAYAEVRIRRPDTGEERWMARRGEHRADGLGGGGRFVGVIYDITEAKRAEAKLREMADALEQRVAERTRERDRVWNRARDLFVVISPEGRYQAVNPAWSEVLGFPEDRLVGLSVGELAHPDDKAAAARAYQVLRRGEPIENLDLRMRTREGGWRWLNWNVVPEGDLLYAMGRDITERKELEEALRQSQKMEAVGQLTGGLAHDFNNMLTGVIGGLDVARRRIEAGRTEEAFRFMDAAVASAERAAGLTQRLLAFSRRQTLDPTPVDIAGLVESMEDLLRRTLGERVALAVVTPEGLWPTRADANQLESAILNLAINARDAMPDGGRLTIECDNLSLDHVHRSEPDTLQPGEYVVISVSDTGMGMPPSVRAKVFDPFFTTKPIGQGTGLGLSMVYGFVRQSGGHVGIYSEAGMGTTVRLYLPRLVGEEARAHAAAVPARTLLEGRGERVLVVEDDPQVRMLVTSVLADLGYELLEAPHAPAALEILEDRGDIRLLVTDVGLPGVNGRQLAEIARQSRPDLPVLFITGYAANASVQADLLGEGMRMITKPFPMDALAAALREMLD